MSKLNVNKASVFSVLAILVLVICLPAIASTAKATTMANDLTAQPLFQIRPAQAGAASIGYSSSSQQNGTTSLAYSSKTGDPAGYSPSQIINAYDLTSSTSGAGATIAIIDAYYDPNIASNLNTFDSEFGLPTPTLTVENMAGTTQNSGWAVETSLDVEWAHAIAPDANILLVEASSDSLTALMSAVNYATTTYVNTAAPVKAVSMSWGSSEFSTESTYDSYLTSTTGIVFFASSGDSGAGVIWPSASPNVVSVGGTTLNIATSTTPLTETAWSDSGGGVSAYEALPAWQYDYGLTYNGRVTPDVSFDANPSTGVAVYDSTPYEGMSGWLEVGGTSVGAPSWAAIQALGTSTGASNFYADGSPSSYFRDITSGSNGYSAAVGYDLVTGLGSPVTTSFTPQYFSISAAIVPTASAPIYAGSTTSTSVPTTVTVTSLNGFAGTVSLVATGPSEAKIPFTATLASPVSISPGSPVIEALNVVVPASTTQGTYQVTVTGTATGSVGTISQSAAFSLKVQNFAISASPTSLSLKSGASGTSTITVTPISDFTGTVSLSATVPSGSGLTTSFSPNTVSITSLASATSTLTVTAGTKTGTYTVTVTGTGATGVPVETATVTVTVSSTTRGGSLFG